MSRIDEVRRRSFDAMAGAYDAIRPSYPEALVDDVFARTGARRVVEVGAGTGQATRLLAARCDEVVALEPGTNLASLLRRNLTGRSNVAVREATFEAWEAPDRSFDLVLAAQSFHWVDPAVRLVKAARVARHLAVVVNEKDRLDEALRADFDAAYARWGSGDGNSAAGIEVAAARRRWTEEIAGSGLFASLHVGAFPWTRRYTTREYLALLDTYSDHATAEETVRRGLSADIAAALDRHGGSVVVPYVALAFVARAR